MYVMSTAYLAQFSRYDHGTDDGPLASIEYMALKQGHNNMFIQARYTYTSIVLFSFFRIIWRGGLVVRRRTCDLVVAGSSPGRDAAA